LAASSCLACSNTDQAFFSFLFFADGTAAPSRSSRACSMTTMVLLIINFLAPKDSSIPLRGEDLSSVGIDDVVTLCMITNSRKSTLFPLGL
jgi:hypothetical protein